MRVLLLLLLLAGGLLLAVREGWLPVEDRWNPWAPLNLAEPPNFLTHWKLDRLAARPEACLAALETAELRFSPLPDQEPQPGCPLENVARVEGGGVAFSSGFLASCPLAAAWAMYERHALQPAAERHLGSRVTSVEHLGSYACRTIAGRSRMSRHATAEALDVAAFRLEDGRRVELLRDWPGEGAEADFLRAARDAACRFFSGTLGPDYNRAHANHFHFEVGGPFRRLCR